MDLKKINKLSWEIRLKKDRLKLEKEIKKKRILKLLLQIDELKIRIERLK